LQQRRIIRIAPRHQPRAAGRYAREFCVEIHLCARSAQAVDRAPIQPGSLPLGFARLPRRLQVAKMIHERANLGRSHAGCSIEGNPVAQIVHVFLPAVGDYK